MPRPRSTRPTSCIWTRAGWSSRSVSEPRRRSDCRDGRRLRMKFLPLLWATLWRRKSRTILTMLSLVAAFLLLGLLQAANSLLTFGTINLSAPILITQARVSFTSPLPMRLLPQLEAVPGVAAVSHSQFFGGIYQDQRNFFP